MKTEPTLQQQADAMQARLLMAKLDDAISGASRFTDGEVQRNTVKVEFQPDLKKVMHEVHYLTRETMADFVRLACIERMQRFLGQRITEGGM